MRAIFQSKHDGFSLVEVVVAVGIFAIAIVSVIGLMVPINASVSEVQASDDASRLATVIQGEIQQFGFTAVSTYLTTPPTGNNRIFASRDMSKVAIGTDAKWAAGHSEKFYVVELTRNTALSPNSAPNLDSNSGFLAFTIKLTWPAFNGIGEAVSASQQSVMLIPAAITR